MTKRLTIAACMVLAVAVLTAMPAQAQTARATDPARYLVPQSVSGRPVRFLGLYKSAAGAQYTYGTHRLPMATMQSPRTGLWYIVAVGLPLSAHSVVGALASERPAGWRGRLDRTGLVDSFVASNGRVCVVTSGTNTPRAAIIVVVAQPSRDCRPAQVRARGVALFVRGRA